MNRTTFLLCGLAPMLAIALSSASLSRSAAQIAAVQSGVNLRVASLPPLQYNAPATSGRGAPRVGRGRGGASRGNCPTVNEPLTALVPSTLSSAASSGAGLEGNQAAQEVVWGQTIAAHPSFWFYVPYSISLQRPAEFTLQNAEGEEVYRTILPSSTATEIPAGIVRVTLPSTAAPLAVDGFYQWGFIVVCEVDNPIATEGWIQRVAPTPALANQLQQAPPQQQANLYAANGFWFDALTTLAERRLAEPQNAAIATDWRRLLESGGLADMATKPIVP